MLSIISLLVFLIFLFLSSIHFYWCFGGRWGSASVFPSKDDNTKPNMPGFLPTFVVAVTLLAVALFILIQGGFLEVGLPLWLNRYGLWILAIIFIIRAIGEFNYVGFFKKIKQTKFGINDTKYYSPLCLVIAILLIIIKVKG
jgi:Protein of unknown function (DUF3995)